MLPTELSDVEELVGEWLTLPEFADRSGEPVAKVRLLLREGKLVAVRRADGVLVVPAAFAHDGAVVRGLSGTLNVLHDAGFAPHEAIRWLFTPDDSLPGRPIEALSENRGTEVRRRAQALAF